MLRPFAGAVPMQDMGVSWRSVMMKQGEILLFENLTSEVQHSRPRPQKYLLGTFVLMWSPAGVHPAKIKDNPSLSFCDDKCTLWLSASRPWATHGSQTQVVGARLHPGGSESQNVALTVLKSTPRSNPPASWYLLHGGTRLVGDSVLPSYSAHQQTASRQVIRKWTQTSNQISAFLGVLSTVAKHEGFTVITVWAWRFLKTQVGFGSGSHTGSSPAPVGVKSFAAALRKTASRAKTIYLVLLCSGRDNPNIRR